MKHSESTSTQDNQPRPTPARITTSLPSRGTISELEQQQQLRALYDETRHFDPPRDGSISVESRSRQPATNTKENVNRNHGPKSSDPSHGHNTPVPLKDKQRNDPNTKHDKEGAVMTDKTNGGVPDNATSAVTPSPKPGNELSPLPPSTSKTASPPAAEDAAARDARRRAWPLRGITEPGANDCLFGRGGGTNHHPGNKLYRQAVEDNKGTYLASKRLDKPLVAMRIIAEWRDLDPPGRFLKQDDRTKVWNDVGDKKAREKTSQALREKTPVQGRDDGDDGAQRAGGEAGRARFASGTASPRHVPRGSLARDHSLGETFTHNEISLEGFSWDDADRPVVRNENADVAPHESAPAGGGRGGGGRGRGGGGGRPRHREEPPQYAGGGERPPRDPYSREEPARREYPPGLSPPHHYPYAREPGPSNNPPPEAGAYQPWEHSSYYGHHYSSPPPPPGHHHGQHPPPPPPPPPPGHGHPPPAYHHPSHPTPPTYASPQNHHPHAGYAHHPPPTQQRSREHSLQMNPLKGASTSQPAPDTFADDQSPRRHHRHGPPPPPLPSPTYENHPSPYNYGYAPSPHAGGWPTPPGGRAAPAPKPQFSYRAGSNPSAFGRYDASSRAGSMESLGSSVDAYYDRRDSGASSGGSGAAAAVAARAAASPPVTHGAHPVVAVAGTSRDFSKIAELIRDSSERTRSNSLDDSSRAEKGGYEDRIPRSKSMPYQERGDGPGSPRADGEEGIPAEPAAARRKPSLLRKLSGGSIPARQSPLSARRPGGGSNGGVCHPKPVKRDTSNQPETLETKRSVKRVVLSRDQSAVSRRLKKEQEESGRSDMSRLKRADLLDRKLSVEINKLGLNDRPSLDRMTTKNILGRMTTEDVLGRQPLDRMTTEDVLGAFIDDDVPPQLGSPSPPALHGDDRTTTIDAIALAITNEISNGNSGAGVDDWGDTLDLMNDPNMPSASVVHDAEMSGGVNADIAEKWLKGET